MASLSAWGFMLSDPREPAPVVRETPRRARETPRRVRETPRVPVVSSPVSTTTCCVCLEDNVAFPTSPPARRCAHNPTVCTQCLVEHIRAAVVGSGHVEVRCPAANCTVQLTYDEVCAAAKGDKALVDRFDSLLLRQALGSDTTFVWCKNPACGSGQYHEDGVAAPIITCRRCHTKSCFEHDVIWHDGLTCSEYDALRQPTNSSTADYLQRHTKVCPSCTRMVEKIAGCDHMVCLRPGGCGHEFCWSCLASYKDIRQYGNAFHKEGCRHRG